MKYIKRLILLLILIIPVCVSATGSIELSKKDINIPVGSTTTFDIIADNCAGKISISSEDTNVATIDKSSEWLDDGKVTVTVKGISIGTTKINVNIIDVTTFDEEVLNGTKNINVNVIEPLPKNDDIVTEENNDLVNEVVTTTVNDDTETPDVTAVGEEQITKQNNIQDTNEIEKVNEEANNKLPIIVILVIVIIGIISFILFKSKTLKQ